jgi:hypothetical protein
MSNIEVIQDCEVARLIWEGQVAYCKDEKSAVSVESVAWSFCENGTEPDYRRSLWRAIRTVKHMTAAQVAVWVADPNGQNTHFRILSNKERNAVQALKVKNAQVKLPEDHFK